MPLTQHAVHERGQGDLFALDPTVAAVFTPPPARARANDPETSHEAAEAIAEEAERQCDQVYGMVCARPGLTSLELAYHFRVDRYMVGRRLSELRDRHKTIRNGDSKRLCTVSRKRNAMTWWPR